MCHFKYWGYDICCHEQESSENGWTPCHLANHVASPRRCPFAGYTRLATGRPYCESCLDETPPRHPPITALISSFEDLRQLMDDVDVDVGGGGGGGGGGGIPRGVRIRFSREYKAELRDVRERAVCAGPDNNFYNDVVALLAIYRRRAEDAVARARAGGGPKG